MKKKVLFVINNLNCGGAEKALISLLETIDYSEFDVDLLLFKQEGIFMSKILPYLLFYYSTYFFCFKNI